MVAPWLLLLTLSATPSAGVQNDAAMAVDFGRDIRPILSRRCTQCHGTADQEGGLSFSDRQTALAELDSGERAVTPGSLDESALWERITWQMTTRCGCRLRAIHSLTMKKTN